MRINIKLIIIFCFMISANITGFAAPEQSILISCSQKSLEEQEKYENEYMSALNKSLKQFKNKDINKSELTTLTQKNAQIQSFSMACESAFKASNNGIGMITFQEYFLRETFTDNSIPQPMQDWIKTIFINMIKYGYSLSDGE